MQKLCKMRLEKLQNKQRSGWKNKIRGDMMIDREMKTTINNWILQGKEAFLLTGARQIGKTYLIRECLKESKYNYVELNFIERPDLVE